MKFPWLGMLTLTAICMIANAGCSTTPLASSETYFSVIDIHSPDRNGDVITLKVGYRATASIGTSIGMFVADSNDEMHPVRGDHWFQDPEYALDGQLPPGLEMNVSTGEIFGTPRSPGTWVVRPMGRSKTIGNDVYRGRGLWRTNYAKDSDGRLWTRSKEQVTFRVSE